MAIYPVSTVSEKTGTVIRKVYRNNSQIAKVIQYGEKSKMRDYGIGRMDVLNCITGKYFNYYNEQNRMVMSLVKSEDGKVSRVAENNVGTKNFIDKSSFTNTIRDALKYLKVTKYLAKK